MIERIPIERVETQPKTSKRIVYIFPKLLTVFSKSFWTCLYKVHNNLLSNFEKKSFYIAEGHGRDFSSAREE